MEVSPRGILLILVISCQALFCFGVEVSTPKGKLLGSDHLKSRNGRTIYSFTNIPYAKPPVGELRFKEAQPAEPWKETFNATKKIATCIHPKNEHLKQGSGPAYKGQEDCLILNVYSPKVGKNVHLPVMFMIHGGSFKLGSSATYGPEFMLEKDVVLVTVNYRLGPFGFVSTGDELIPANMGLKDQSLGLKWVHDNIEGFGGNPAQITVIGESAGAASTHMHLMSPMSKGMIFGGIAQSGNAFLPWALIDSKLIKNRTKALAGNLGCTTEPSKEMLACMQSVTAEKILEATDKISDSPMNVLMAFGPTIEGNVKNAFLPAHPKQLESHIPLVIGISSGEGCYVASLIFGSAGVKFFGQLTKNPDRVLPLVLMLSPRFEHDQLQKVSGEVKQFYFGNKTIDKNSTNEVIEMFTDSWFLDGTLEAASHHKGPVYFYFYDYLHSVSYNSLYGAGDIKGVTHSDIMLNLFPLHAKFPNRPWSETDVLVSKQLVELWTNFAKTGKPIASQPEWKPTAKFLHIKAPGEPPVEENLLPRRVDFWKDLNNRLRRSELTPAPGA